ncbi:MAG: glutamate--cysteine ligase [Acidimicrobiales bacterium]
MGIEFKASERCTLGVEVELQIVDRQTRQLVSAATPILDELGATCPDGEHPKAKHELFESCIEIITGICDTVEEAKADLSATLKEVEDAAAVRGLGLMCAGSHPFSDWQDQQISPSERYAALVQEMQWVARRMQIFGVHFHVGVRSAEKVIATANALRAYIPHFLALSASSPFWVGTDTGMASSRTTVFENLPTAGLPYVLKGWDEFEAFMATLISAGAISSIREVWWDIRPHPDFGTVELRICDGVATLREVSGLAAFAQCLVHWIDGRLDAGDELWVPREWTVRQNKWRAARHGMQASVIADETGRQMALPDAVAEVVGELGPIADELGCADELSVLAEIVEHGPSYVRQRNIIANGGRLVDVVDALVSELAADRPDARPG